ncbi:hypothetical protein MY04_5178 [Flammeovirga sp. MY04]|uniref:hypothetical protein n=1 Tax=Flammeovirga sp. MY04 TaxID=1191459 RepID=UPI0008060B02|nr:hypothetical protein [Flammeovirga sp. MY04]ANQ52510.1 hypothetical protein MY04_5178 [Flammeovirga sp. MY04]
MNFEEIKISSKEERDQFIELIIADNLIDDLYESIKKFDNPHGNRLAWVVSTISDKNDQILSKYVDDLITWLPGIKTQGIKRSLLRGLVHCPLSIDKEGEWVEFLFDILSSSETDIAVKVHSMELLSRYCEKYPELSQELIIILEDALPYYSAAGKVRAKRILKKFSN